MSDTVLTPPSPPLIAEANLSILTPLISNSFSYWGAHIVSILLCLDQHTYLTYYPPRDLGEAWSLHDYRGYYRTDDFAQIRNSIQNWGTQYLIAELVNSNSFNLKSTLLNEFQEMIGKPLTEATCYVSGRDSSMGFSFLQTCRARLFADQRRRISSTFASGHKSIDIRFRDVCIVTYPNINRDGIAFFGETEGNHGEKLLRESFWLDKPHSSFGIGLHKKSEQSIQLVRVPCDKGFISVIIFGTQNNAIIDFHTCLRQFELLVREGPTSKFWMDLDPNGPRELLGFIASKWRTPVKTLIELLHGTSGTHTDLLRSNTSLIHVAGSTGQNGSRNLYIPDLLV